ncbi:hypothetical protein QJN79_22505, partial [Escherichia coli]
HVKTMDALQTGCVHINTVEESEEKAGLRERVKNALNELER